MSKIEEPEELKTIQDHIDLLSSLLFCAQELPQTNSEENMLEDEFVKMTAKVVKSMALKCNYIIKRSAKYHKKPKLHKRIKEHIEEWQKNRRQRRLENAQYRSFLEWQKSMLEKSPPEPPEPPQDVQVGLPVCQPSTSIEVVDEETNGDESQG